MRDERREALIGGFQIRDRRTIQDRNCNGVQVNQGFLLLRFRFRVPIHPGRRKRRSRGLKFRGGIFGALGAQAERHRQQGQQSEPRQESECGRAWVRERTFIREIQKMSIHFRIDSNTLFALIANGGGASAA